MLYDTCANFIVGQPFGIFSLRAFVGGMLFFYPIFLLFVPMFLMLTLIRHSSRNKIAGMITISILSLAAWVFTVPVSFRISEQLPGGPESSATLSGGYFRNIKNSSYYFTQVVGNFVDGIRIDTSRFASEADINADGAKTVTILNDRPLNFHRDEFGFADPLVGGALRFPKELSFLADGFFSMRQCANAARQSGIANWLRFSSVILALLSVGAILSASTWRLADALYVIFDTAVIIFLNYLFLNSYFDEALIQLKNLGGFFIFIYDNFQVIMNCLIVILLALIGTVKHIVHSSRRREAAE